MAKRIPCEHCSKSHHTFAGRDRCETKHFREQCACPRYWRRRWTSHCLECPLRGTHRDALETDEEETASVLEIDEEETASV